jgi:hypothetical protein
MSAMIDDKVLRILGLTIEGTEKGKLRWQVSENDEEVFVNKTASGSELKMFPHSDYSGPVGEGPPSLTLYDTSGEMIVDITENTRGVGSGVLENLYEQVRRAAQGVDEKLDAILSDLEKDPEIPF